MSVSFEELLEMNVKLVCVMMQDRNVHMIITDYCMPEMTGFDLLKRVKVSISDSHSAPLSVSGCCSSN
mgnify:CR=1 FL=1|jgi:YesN/AraC family two-component response regulator